MHSAAAITAPPPARSPHPRRQDPPSTSSVPSEDDQHHHSIDADAFSSIWANDCGYASANLSLQISCFTGGAAQRTDLPNYETFQDPSLTFLSLVQPTSSAPSTSTTVDDVPTTSSANDFPVNTQPSTTQSPTSSSSSSSPNVGAIVGGVIGGVALLALAAAAFLFLRRHKKRHAAPSAEFMHMARGASPTFSAKHVEASAMSMNGDHMPLARHSSIEEEDPPPAFSPGSFKDPVFEKVSASAAMREQYEARDAEGGYKD